MNTIKHTVLLLVLLILAAKPVTAALAQTEPPAESIKLIFIHHSCGENWLTDGYGNLGRTLGENNYFVSDTNYGWGRHSIGDRTDIVDWQSWFGPGRDERVLSDLYNETNQLSSYTRTMSDPGGENQIIMFKSCFPNSDLGGSPDDPPQAGYDMTVGGAKQIYMEMLDYFSTRPDKMFVAITAPPLLDPTHAQNARAFNQWLVTDWLDGYSGNNVYVFDFHALLTHPDNHHRVINGSIEYINTNGNGTLHYDSGGDEHPNEIGSQKATDEFVPLLNLYVQRWRGTQPSPQIEAPAAEVPQSGDEAGQPQPAVPQVTAGGNVIDNFDTDTRFYDCYSDEDGSTYEIGGTSERAFDGANALKMSYNIDTDGWLDCGSHYDNPQDWSIADGISLAISSQHAGQEINFTVFMAGESGPIPYEVKFTTTDAMVTGWEAVSLSWQAFSLAPWADGGPDQLNPAAITGYAVGIPSGPAENTLYLDGIQLGQVQDEQDTPPAAEALPVPQIEEPPAEENDSGRFLPSVCPGAFILPLLACLMFLVTRRFI